VGNGSCRAEMKGVQLEGYLEHKMLKVRAGAGVSFFSLSWNLRCSINIAGNRDYFVHKVM
jgi:hypothetical protein